jgi:hypothetical protein
LIRTQRKNEGKGGYAGWEGKGDIEGAVRETARHILAPSYAANDQKIESSMRI